MDAAGVLIIAYLPVCLLTSKMGKASIFHFLPLSRPLSFIFAPVSFEFSHVSGQVRPENVFLYSDTEDACHANMSPAVIDHFRQANYNNGGNNYNGQSLIICKLSLQPA